jgi:hypothetical protein
MGEIADRFERLVERWVHESGLAEAWRRHFYDGAPQPDGPVLAEPPLFRGRTDANARIEVRRIAANAGSEDVEIVSDGVRIGRERGPWTLDADAMEPVTIAGQACIDTNDASPDAIAALRDFIARPGTAPPWQLGRELYEDGLIDIDFALTARGGRCLARLAADDPASSAGSAVRARPAGTRARYCVIVAGAARARILLLATAESGLSPTLMPLTEVADLARLEGRTRDRDLRSDGRRESGREFAEQVAEAASRVWRTLPACDIVVVANRTALGQLRPAIARRTGGAIPHNVHELARDLGKLAPAALHDALATAGLVPPRGRRQPVRRWQRDKNAR